MAEELPTWDSMISMAILKGLNHEMDEARFFLDLAREIRTKDESITVEYDKISKSLKAMLEVSE